MRIPSGKILLVYGVLLGSGAALAVGQGELSVERQDDGTLVISNTGNDKEAAGGPKGGAAFPGMPGTSTDQGAVTPGRDFTGAGIGAGPGVSVGTGAANPGAGEGAGKEAAAAAGAGGETRKPGAITAPNPRPGTKMSVPSGVDPQSTVSQARYRDRMLQETGSGTHSKNPASARRYLMMDRGTYQSGTR